MPRKNPPLTGDTVRRDILEWFHGLNKRGRAPQGIQDVCKGIKADYGHKGPLVREHLTYLVDLGYIHKEVEMTKVQTGQTTRDQARTRYRLRAKGIEYMEGKSEFSDRERFPGINITATGGSTIVLGDGNVVNSQFKSIYDELGRLRLGIADTTEMNDAAKLEASVAVDTIRGQLALPSPDQSIVEKAWGTVTKICTAATLTDYVVKVAPLIAGLFGG